MEEKLHVLVIEDDPLIRRMLGGLLLKMDMNIETLYAANGVEGWEMSRRLRPDLILLDYHIPEMDGLVTAQRLKSDDLTKTIPIIFLTNEDLTTEAQKGVKELGVEEYLHKSADYEAFSAVVKRYLSAVKKKPF